MNATFDPYRVLGLAKDADAAAIKKAYRKLAKAYHPDRGGDPEQFKAVGRAHEVLSDPDKRALFDEFGPVSLQPGFDPAMARGGFRGDPRGGFDGTGDFDMNDLLSQLFGGGRGAPRGGQGFGGFGGQGFGGQTPGVRAELSLDLRTACLGGVRQLTTQAGSMSVRIPPGVRDGESLRLKGQGDRVGGPPGSDLHLTLRIEAHPVFRREGEDLHVDLPVTVAEAIGGGSVRVPTLDGAVDLKVPAGTQAGRTLRLRGKGVARRGKAAGDLYVHVQVKLPEALDAAALQALERAYQGDVRDDLLRAAAA